MNGSKNRTLLLVSLGLNLVFLAGAARMIRARGGWEYLKSRLPGAPAASGTDPDAANYAHRESLFQRLPRPKAPIVFAGDSLTQGCEWGEFYPGALNRGIGGDTSAGLLRRIGTITGMRPRAVFLMIGINDLLNLHLTPAQTVGNTRAIIAEIRRRSPLTRIYVQSTLPTRVVQKNLYARSVNQGLKGLSDGSMVFYVDLYPSFLERDLLNPNFTSDGVHLNGDGYLLWKHLIDPCVQGLMSGTPGQK